MIIPSKHSGYGEGGRLTSTRRVYDSGGGGGGTQTSIQDLPDWAKGTAKNVLGAAESTVFKKDASGKVTGFQPYQQYGGQRTAQFTPLQQQAYGNAYGMDAGPQGFAQNIGTYMSPYQQNVIDREKMEAARASQLLGQQQQAQATQAGAFGGYREGIQRAERERGLRSQMQDIQARGSQAAYDRAADQFRQGITQQMAVGQQQAQFGTQQQGQIQKALDTAYQDFLNEQKFPMQQIGYLSDILRGTPMGGTTSLYGAPGSLMGQLGGIGMGLYGMSKMFADGGAVDADTYADGGVTSDDNVKGILDNLSVAQLKQSRQIAVSSGDAARVRMIDEELAQRASEESGLSSAYNQLPSDTQEDMVSAAGGGIIAFAGGGTEDGPTPEEIEAAKRPYVGTPMITRPRGKEYGESNLGRRIQEFLVPPTYAVERPAKVEPPKVEPPKAEAPQRAAPAPALADEPKAAKVAPIVLPALQALASQTGAPIDALLANQKRLETYFSAQRKEDLKSLTDIVSAQMGEGKKLKEEALPAALAAFGFEWAKAASKPGARFLGSAAEASPVLNQVSADYRKAIREANKADMQLKLTLRQFDIAQRNGDQRLAATLAHQAEVLQAQRNQNALQAQQLAQHGAIAQAQLTQRESQFGRTLGLQEKALSVRGLAAAAQLARIRQMALKDWEAGPAPRLQRQLAQKYGKNWADQPAAQAEYQTQKRDYLGSFSPAGSSSTATPVSSLLSAADLGMSDED
jgi:hypothetical protein